jgi:hypothetical protein
VHKPNCAVNMRHENRQVQNSPLSGRHLENPGELR